MKFDCSAYYAGFRSDGHNYGGTLFLDSKSSIVIRNDSRILINNNKASHGAAICTGISYLLIDGNSVMLFNNNSARIHGGAISLGATKSLKWLYSLVA